MKSLLLRRAWLLLWLGLGVALFPAQVQGDALSGDGWRVVLVDVTSGAELWSAPAAAGDEVVYRYTHSADKTPVKSLLRVVGPDAGFVVEQERYLWYGAGLEYLAAYGVGREGRWVLVQVDRPVTSLLLRVAGTVEQHVSTGELKVVLGDVAYFGDRLLLEVRP